MSLERIELEFKTIFISILIIDSQCKCSTINDPIYKQVIINKQLFQESLILVICLGMILIMYPRKLGQTEFNKELQRYQQQKYSILFPYITNLTSTYKFLDCSK